MGHTFDLLGRVLSGCRSKRKRLKDFARGTTGSEYAGGAQLGDRVDATRWRERERKRERQRERERESRRGEKSPSERERESEGTGSTG